MEISRVEIADAAQARGIVIVIDVIRAFTVAMRGGSHQQWDGITYVDVQRIDHS